MKNVSQDVSQGASQKKKGLVKMSKSEKLSNEITDFIMSNDFLINFIVDNVKDKIYVEKSYNESMIENVLINDIDAGYSNSYILDYIIDEIDIYQITFRIDDKYRDEFIELVKQCNTRNW